MQLAVLFSLTGIAMSALWPALEAWIGELQDGRPLVRRISLFNLSWTGGLMIGYVSGGYISDLHAFAPFYFSCAAALCAAAGLSIQPTPQGRGAHKNKQEIVDDEQFCAEPQLATKYLYLGWTANFLSYLTLGILRYIFPRFIYELGMAPRVFGRLMMFQAGAQFLMFLILGTTKKWHYKFMPLVIFQILASIGFLCIWFSDSSTIWIIGLMSVGLNIGMTYSASMYYSLCGHLDLGGKSGWHESVLHSGILSSTLIGGALANFVGLKSPYLFCAAVAIIGIPIQLRILRKKAASS